MYGLGLKVEASALLLPGSQVDAHLISQNTVAKVLLNTNYMGNDHKGLTSK